MNMLNQKQKLIVITLGIIAILAIGYYYISSTKDVYNYENFASQVLDESEKEKIEEETIIVHVTGAVRNQGIVKVKENSRINDVIEAAGGLENGADLNKVNLAYMVEDGQKIYIPYEKEGQEVEDDEEIMTQSAGNKVLEDNENSSESGPININTANQEKLQDLPGIRSFYCFKNYCI